MVVGAELWQRLHGISANFFRRILKEGSHPVSSGFPLLRGAVLCKHDGYCTDDRDSAQALSGCREIEGLYVVPECITVELAQGKVVGANALI